MTIVFVLQIQIYLMQEQSFLKQIPVSDEGFRHSQIVCLMNSLHLPHQGRRTPTLLFRTFFMSSHKWQEASFALCPSFTAHLSYLLLSKEQVIQKNLQYLWMLQFY